MPLKEGHKSTDLQAGYRQGAGVAIAALAAASELKTSGSYSSQTYLETAANGYWHLKA